jgi:hypothetical protein
MKNWWVRLLSSLSDVFVLGLSLDLLDHFLSSDFDGLHGHCGEPVGDHSSFYLESKGHKGSRTNGESFSDGSSCVASSGVASSGVASSVEEVSSLSDPVRASGHFGVSASVVRDWAIAVNCEGNLEVGEHAEGREREQLRTNPSGLEGDPDGDAEANDWDDVGGVSEGKSHNDVRGSFHSAGLSEFLDGSVVF